MLILVSALFSVAFIALLLGFINPRFVIFTGLRRNRAQVFKVYGSLAIMSLVIMGISTYAWKVPVSTAALQPSNTNSKTVDLIKNADVGNVLQNPLLYRNTPVELTGTVSSEVKQYGDITKFQLSTGNQPLIVVINKYKGNLKAGDNVQLRGTVGLKLSGDDLVNKPLETVSVLADTITKDVIR